VQRSSTGGGPADATNATITTSATIAMPPWNPWLVQRFSSTLSCRRIESCTRRALGSMRTLSGMTVRVVARRGLPPPLVRALWYRCQAVSQSVPLPLLPPLPLSPLPEEGGCCCARVTTVDRRRSVLRLLLLVVGSFCLVLDWSFTRVVCFR